MAHLDVIREIRRKLAIDGPPRIRAADDFATVTLPERDCDAVRDLLIAERPHTVIEIGLAYGSSALAIGEALISVEGDRHLILDPFQDSGFRDAGWEVIRRRPVRWYRDLVEGTIPDCLATACRGGDVSGCCVRRWQSCVPQRICRPVLPADDHTTRWPGCSRRSLVARGGYGGSLLRD